MIFVSFSSLQINNTSCIIAVTIFFKTEDAHLYFREILKQDMNNFVDYYNLFYQKKECSLMKDFSLIDCLKCNVNYFTQVVVFF